jgi:hypothetical protein
MIWIALAAQISAPVLSNPAAIFSTGDTPAYIEQKGVVRDVVTRTTIRPDSTVEGCSAERSSGDAKLDEYTCGLILKRLKIKAASKWLDGTPTYGVIRLPVVWMASSSTHIPPAEDLDIALNKLPNGVHSPATTHLILGVDEAGRVVTCEGALPRWPGEREGNPILVQLGCEQLTRTYTAIPARDDKGSPVRSVQDALVSFSD